MAPVVFRTEALRRRVLFPRDDTGSNSMTLTPIYIIGIVVIVVGFIGLVFWLTWRRWKKNASSTHIEIDEKGGNSFPEKAHHSGPRPNLQNAFDRSRLTASIILPVSKQDVGGDSPAPFSAYLPPMRHSVSFRMSQIPSLSPRATSFSSGTPSRGSQLRHSILPSDSDKHASLTEKEILDYHLSQGNMPAAFAPIAVGPMHKTNLSLDGHGSVTANFLSMAEEEHNATKHKHTSTMSSLPWPRLSPGPQAHSPVRSSLASSLHSRFPSLSASIRFPGGSPPTSPARSVFSFGKKHRPPSRLPDMGVENQRTIEVDTFNPLLPDELIVKKGQSVTVVQSFDDDWCIIARMHLGMVELGAVPIYVFGFKDGEDATFAAMRPMRSTSLGVTVDLRIIEALDGPAKPGARFGETAYRDSVISWANF